MFLGSGYKSRGFHSFVTPCSFSEHGPGRQAAAEWVQAAFHDMATTDVYYANKGSVHGGIDASLAFELNSGENIGSGLYSSLATYARFFNSRLSVSDLIALGVYAGVRACGGPAIPMRGGRIDATSAGPLGVPQPQNGIGQFTNQFTRMGFSKIDMIAMTACGHTLGGVHADSFDDVVIRGTAPNDFQLFDGTEAFDNKIATRYIYGPDINPLSVGISRKNKKDSDFQVFSSDNNVTLKAMTDSKVFESMCASILQRMIETVPPGVTLSDVIEPYEVKPSDLQLTLLSGGVKLSFSGEIRVRTAVHSALKVVSVKLLYKDRNGISIKRPIEAELVGTARGFDDSFWVCF
jgi:Peroxidase